MPLFEPYRHKTDNDERLPAIEDLLIRPAVLADATELGEIQAAREGREAHEYVSRLERALGSSSEISQGLILAGQHAGKIVGIAKTNYFTPPDDSPANVAPPGWYLTGVIVIPEYRRRGVGRRMTEVRLDWIAERDHRAYYFASVQNRVTIELHQQLGFVELTRDFFFPGMAFTGGIGALFMAELPDSTSISPGAQKM